MGHQSGVAFGDLLLIDLIEIQLLLQKRPNCQRLDQEASAAEQAAATFVGGSGTLSLAQQGRVGNQSYREDLGRTQRGNVRRCRTPKAVGICEKGVRGVLARRTGLSAEQMKEATEANAAFRARLLLGTTRQAVHVLGREMRWFLLRPRGTPTISSPYQRPT